MKLIIDFPTTDGSGYILKICKENHKYSGKYITKEDYAALYPPALPRKDPKAAALRKAAALKKPVPPKAAPKKKRFWGKNKR